MQQAYAGWWLVAAALQVYALSSFGLAWTCAVQDALIFTGLCALGCLSVGFVFRFYQPGPGGWLYRAVTAAGMAAVACWLFYLVMTHVFVPSGEYADLLHRSMPVRFLFALVLLSFHVVLMWVFGVLDDQDVVNKRRGEAEALAREAELATLRQQLHPHFLFNSLNSISALAGSDPEAARRMIHQLSDFLRGTLKKDETPVKAADELAQLRLYLDIERVRFGHRLTVEVTMDEACGGLMVPPLVLQPVVENAIKYGLYGVAGQVTIRIHVTCENNLLKFVVTNPFDPVTAGQPGTGFGLKGVTRRLELIYGRADLVRTRREGNIFETEIRVPQ